MTTTSHEDRLTIADLVKITLAVIALVGLSIGLA